MSELGKNGINKAYTKNIKQVLLELEKTIKSASDILANELCRDIYNMHHVEGAETEANIVVIEILGCNEFKSLCDFIDVYALADLVSKKVSEKALALWKIDNDY